jgi:catechol 2,3-dioxygenase-like lactoylglutathione lyase family enzyme
LGAIRPVEEGESLMPHLYRVIPPVRDIEAASRFYAGVLGSAGRRVSPGRHYFDCEGTILACFDPMADGDGYVAEPNPEPLYFAVSDLRATYQACETEGATFSKESPPGVGPLGQIAKRPWGEESFYVSDPFANPVCFVSRDTVFTG